jgi:hypothetical protein
MQGSNRTTKLRKTQHGSALAMVLVAGCLCWLLVWATPHVMGAFGEVERLLPVHTKYLCREFGAVRLAGMDGHHQVRRHELGSEL